MASKAQQLDYQAPQHDVRSQLREQAAVLYATACREHKDVNACVWAISLTLSSPSQSSDTEERIATVTDVLGLACNDRKDDNACRVFDDEALTRTSKHFSNARALCQRGLPDACYAASRDQVRPEEREAFRDLSCELGDPNGCFHQYMSLEYLGTAPAMAVLAKQRKGEVARCARGSGAPCYFLLKDARCEPRFDGACASTPLDAHESELAMRAESTMTEGCNRGYLHECWLPLLAKPSLKLLPKACMNGRNCSELVELLRSEGGAATELRDALEHGCQFGDNELCVALVNGYRAKEFPEPVVGRERALTTYICSPADDYMRGLCDRLK